MTQSSAGPDPVPTLAQLLKAAGDERRLEVLRALARDSFGVLELSRIFETTQPGMSHHLKVLTNARLVTRRKEGNSIFYRRAPIDNTDAHASVRTAILQAADDLPLRPETQTQLEEVFRQRAEISQSFFSERAEQFHQQQDLIAAYEVYGPQVAESLDSSDWPSRSLALEVGPGAGEFLCELSTRFERVIALDTSAEMLAQAKANSVARGEQNIEFVCNDTRHCRDIPESLDGAVINMVLHHVPSPPEVFEDLATALKPGGVLWICDLDRHEQDWTREACGDQWLGFTPEELSDWAEQFDLQEKQSHYIALRNGFQIQLREFFKPFKPSQGASHI